MAKKPMSHARKSRQRTIVPMVVGWLIAEAAKQGADVDPEMLTPLVAYVYYEAVRQLEAKWPALGWLIGAPGAPSYEDPTPPPSPPEPDDEV